MSKEDDRTGLANLADVFAHRVRNGLRGSFGGELPQGQVDADQYNADQYNADQYSRQNLEDLIKDHSLNALE